MTVVRNFLAANPLSHGARYSLVLASVTKRELSKRELAPVDRLTHLQDLDSIVRSGMTQQMVSVVEPICEDGLALYIEACQAEPKKAIDILAMEFASFAVLNPSLLGSVHPVRSDIGGRS
jgi:hypothetical protein